jgi:alkyl hydroperoxide reductase subunit AhpC
MGLEGPVSPSWPVLADINGKVARFYRVLTSDGRFLEGHTERSVFIIEGDVKAC